MNSGDYRVPHATKIDLDNWDPGDRADIPDKETGKDILKKNRKQIIDLQERLYAESESSLLVVFQAMDTGGKDGCIENVFKGVNPSGCRVHSFKQPNPVELSHDFLWRYHHNAPAAGFVGVFNRSHYEDVLVVRVKDLIPESIWRKRYDQINAFEEILEDRGTKIIKFYLHISREEQKHRLESRLANPNKQWKYSSADLKERMYWDDYQRAFEDVLGKCSTESAPWYIVPANHKWFRDVIVSTVVREALESLDPQFPEPEENLDGVTIFD